ncbi:MAG TPA: hypothetical protein IGS52_03455 [Oscillatoriaceae cyanobacterium M33_DOE_052]|uniref:Uncharacterized protein n=1 Tax=Planktothricoides sp. SpSt-374 TaxID=2282167 RepID=A0A7C3ZQ48_9CYAN|nr:hypothetical protein [Oscillatoriaceae cyanobacterium M33_DOE_052]
MAAARALLIESLYPLESSSFPSTDLSNYGDLR